MITPRILIGNLLGSIRQIEALLEEAETRQITSRETTHSHQEHLQEIQDLISTADLSLKDIKDSNKAWAIYGLNIKTTELNNLKASIKNIKRWKSRLRTPTNNQYKEDSAPDTDRPLDISNLLNHTSQARTTNMSKPLDPKDWLHQGLQYKGPPDRNNTTSPESIPGDCIQGIHQEAQCIDT